MPITGTEMYRNCLNKSGILIPVFFRPKINMVFSGRELIQVFFHGKNNSGIFNWCISQPENKYGIFHARKINTVFIFVLDSRWTAGGQSKWTEWTEVCPLGREKVV